jgi:hypothetical protein
MKLGIMQPYFLPYPGYYALIKHTDRFILLDEVQFIRHGWIERNRVLKQNEGWVYIKVPVIRENGRETIIKQTRIDNSQVWKEKIMAQLQIYRKRAPYYYKVTDLLNELFSHDYDDIVSLDHASLEIVSDYIGIGHHIEVFSSMGIVIDKPGAPDEWALNICKSLGEVDEYWNPAGGLKFFSARKYVSAGIELKIMQYNQDKYSQGRNDFEGGLSVIDALMFNSPEAVNKMLDNFELMSAN